MRIPGDNARSLGFRGRSRGALAVSLLAALMVICPIGRTAARTDDTTPAPAASTAPAPARSGDVESSASAAPHVHNRHSADVASRPASMPARRPARVDEAAGEGVYHTSLQ